MSRDIREPNSLTSIAFNTGVIAERQRIIRLLSHPTWHDLQFSGRKDGDAEIMFHVQGCIGCRQILLIKGEN
jgi:hypothetical protein